MEFENLITLIKTVSDSALTDFEYSQDGVKLRMKKKATVQTVACQSIPVQQNLSVEKTAEELEGNLIKSPLVGRFYVAPAEDAEPFVTVGDNVKQGQTVAIVEAMKLMNDIESDFNGVVAEVLVQNGDTVEYGQPLFRIV